MQCPVLVYLLTMHLWVFHGGQDVTNEEEIRVNPKCDRELALFGFLRGANLKEGQRVRGWESLVFILVL